MDNIVNLFAIPVFKFKVVPTDIEYSELTKALDMIFERSTEGKWASETGKSSAEHHLFLHNIQEMQWLLTITAARVHKVWAELNYANGKNITCPASWANLHKPGQVTGEHSHCSGAEKSHLSAVYYFKKPADSGNIEFRDPLDYIHSLTPKKDYVLETYAAYSEVKAEEFDLLVFPSWLKHRSQVNRSQDNRIAISMNFIGN
ncbi:Conserved hypothetical protein CHP02466 [uncultured Caudovirales phage]|uniref:Uncharacterized protein n=1 Tax=uncultured Caudovirales phage TaxID=2100421 RepID=A0A6J7WDP8_9CAUD|nr:Conserved hypothetical protein CHP02466 [uncultured Caudovirales phage]CAB5209054.1 Conserved hypothetical protein CHP02466 [uncultured Caudovirales phage]